MLFGKLAIYLLARVLRDRQSVFEAVSVLTWLAVDDCV